MRNHEYHVYIAASPSRTLYIGVTSDIEGRMWEHKHRIVKGFTAKYGVDRLVYVEDYRWIDDAIAREKQLKGWRREKKIALVETVNPKWRDLSHGWFN